MGRLKLLARIASTLACALGVLSAWAAAGLEKIKAMVLAINAAADERNAPEFGLLDREIRRVRNGRVLLIPAGDSTAGHGMTGMAKVYPRELGELLQSARRLSP